MIPEARIIDDLPAGVPILRFPEEARTGTEMRVYFEPAGGEPWAGVFVHGDRKGLSGLHPVPGSQKLVVVANGASWLVDPRKRAALPLVSSLVRQAWTVHSHRLVLLADPWQLFAIGPGGEVWRTDRLAVDGLKIVRETRDDVVVQLGEMDEGREARVLLANGQTR